MNPFKFVWGMFFRLFPCPTKIELCRIGNPDRESPVLVTCNFYITVRRLIRSLKGVNAWLLVADSKGVNVWCAAGGEEFNTHSVVSAVKTSGIKDLVDHRRLILPSLGAPGINAKDVENQTGWTVCWGPVRIKDIPAYLKGGQQRSEEMKRVTYNWCERLDTSIGALFPFFLVGALGFLISGPTLLWHYLRVATITFFFFMLICPWLPGKRGLTKVIFLETILAIILVVSEVHHFPNGFSIRADLIIAMVMLFVYGSELGGLTATMPSDLDPFLAKLGIGAVGNVAFAGTVRTELLNGLRELTYDRAKCVGCCNCMEVCPQGCWTSDAENHAVLAKKEKCTACRACIVQCEGEAIKASPKMQGNLLKF
jgi:NAD-dependent dihydropyrimidine dehydrogenase PreA subunit